MTSNSDNSKSRSGRDVALCSIGKPPPSSVLHCLSIEPLMVLRVDFAPRLNQSARLAAGGVQLPSTIEGGVVVGQYKRMTKTNLPFGAGSQLASFALPGDSACRYMSTEPSGLVMNLLRWLNS